MSLALWCVAVGRDQKFKRVLGKNVCVHESESTHEGSMCLTAD